MDRGCDKLTNSNDAYTQNETRANKAHQRSDAYIENESTETPPANKNSVAPLRSDTDSQHEKQLVMVNRNKLKEMTSVLKGLVFGKQSKIFLDTGSQANLISLKSLRERVPGVVFLEPTKYILQGVTGDELKTLGETEVQVEIENLFQFNIKAVVVEESFFPGDLLIGYKTMEKHEIALVPAQGCAEIEYYCKVPFLKEDNNTNLNENWGMCSIRNNNVVERSPTVKSSEEINRENKPPPLVESSPSQPPVVDNPSQINDNTIVEPTNIKVEPTKINDETSQPDQSWLLTTGHVTGSTLLQSMSVTKVTVKLRGVNSNREVISLPEFTKLKGCYLDSAVYMSYDGTVDVL